MRGWVNNANDLNYMTCLPEHDEAFHGATLRVFTLKISCWGLAVVYNTSSNRTNQTQDQQEYEIDNNLVFKCESSELNSFSMSRAYIGIGGLFHFTSFTWCFAWIEHNLGLIASKQHHANYPTGIS